jgi:hypothetical protein
MTSCSFSHSMTDEKLKEQEHQEFLLGAALLEAELV